MNGRDKYNQYNHLLSQLSKENEWLIGGIKMLKNEIDIKDIPIFIQKAIEEYNKINKIGK